MAQVVARKPSSGSALAQWVRRPGTIRLFSLLLALAAWQIGGSLSTSLSLPTLSETAVAWWKLTSTGELPAALGLSMISMALGLGIAIVFGVIAGLVIGWYQSIEEATDIYLSLLMVLPMMALVPIIIAVLGLTMAARVCVVFLFALITIIVNSAAGVKQVDNALVEMARSFGASSPQLFFRILLPSAMPSIVAGVRLGTGRAFVGMISAEMLVTAVGFGNLILEYSAKFKPEFVFATLITVIAVALMIGQLLRGVENRLLAWMHTQSH